MGAPNVATLGHSVVFWIAADATFHRMGVRRPGRPSFASPLDKRRVARQVRTMGFGPFRVKAKSGELRIATSAAAMAFVRSLEPSRRTSYHWKVAERMIHFAWMSAEDEALAERAFQIALETDSLLIP